MSHWYRQVSGTWAGCTAHEGDLEALEALHIADLEGLFYIFLMGNCSATLILIIEKATRNEVIRERRIFKKINISKLQMRRKALR